MSGLLQPIHCVEIDARLQGHMVRMPVKESGKATTSILCIWYHRRGGGGRDLQRYLRTIKGLSVRASDVFWSWVSSSLSSGLLQESPNAPVTHPNLGQNDWGRHCANQCGLELRLTGWAAYSFIGLSDRVLDWLRSRVVDPYELPCEPSSRPGQAGWVPAVLGCERLGREGPVYCTSAVLSVCRRNLADGFKRFGGAKTYWCCVGYLAYRGNITQGTGIKTSDSDFFVIF